MIQYARKSPANTIEIMSISVDPKYRLNSSGSVKYISEIKEV
jgi:hypothetical protein